MSNQSTTSEDSINLPVSINVEVTEEHFESVIVTALEGGSNYWYMLPKDKTLDELIKDYQDSPLSERISKTIFNNKDVKLPIFDIEEPDDVLGYLSNQSMLDAFKKRPDLLMMIIDESYDADTADALFQIAVMGEITFG